MGDQIPAGALLEPGSSCIEPASSPVSLGRFHGKRLRQIVAYGRPVSVSTLTGVDLDLLVCGLISTVDRGSACAVVEATPAGLEYVSQLRQAKIAALQPHSSLGGRLAAHLRSKGRATWENLLFYNPVPVGAPGGLLWRQVRPDVFACEMTLQASKARPEIYEVKVTRSDFLADLAKPSKSAAYRDLAEAVYFCAPDGVIGVDELPNGIGLLCEDSCGRFVLRHRAKRRKGFVLAADTLITLVVKRAMLPGGDE